MPKKRPTIPVVCTACARPFTLTPLAYARRVARYGATLLCQQCLTDGWLRMHQGRHADRLARENAPIPPGGDT